MSDIIKEIVEYGGRHGFTTSADFLNRFEQFGEFTITSDDRRVTVYRTLDFFDKNAKPEIKINWSGCGDNSIEETAKFIENMHIAKNIAEFLALIKD